MKDYIIIANGVVSEFETEQEMNKGLELLAGSQAPTFAFKRIETVHCCDACQHGEKCESEDVIVEIEPN